MATKVIFDIYIKTFLRGVDNMWQTKNGKDSKDHTIVRTTPGQREKTRSGVRVGW